MKNDFLWSGFLIGVLVILIVWIAPISDGEIIEQKTNYTTAHAICQQHGGLPNGNLFRSSSLFSAIIENTNKLDGYDSLKESTSVWASGLATTGPYIALYTCMSLDKHAFTENVTFHTDVLYECSVHCALKLNKEGFFGITGKKCVCIVFTYRFPHTPECLQSDFLDIDKGIVVFKLRESVLMTQSESPDFNCISASIEKDGTEYYNTKCLSTIYGICSNRVDSDLSSKCTPKLNNGAFCLNKKNTTFLEHTQNCLLYNGTLLSFNSGITLSINSSVMLGSFRAFKAIEDGGENKDNGSRSCLTITKFNGTIYLETENCSNVNAFICMADIQETTDNDGSATKDGDGARTVHARQIVLMVICIVVAAIVIVVVIPLARYCIRQFKGIDTSKNDIQQQSYELVRS